MAQGGLGRDLKDPCDLESEFDGFSASIRQSGEVLERYEQFGRAHVAELLDR